MIKLLSRLVFWSNGWKISHMPPDDIKRYVLIGAPHTSNWDFIYGMAASYHMNLSNLHFTIKKEWLRFPFNLILKPLGAIGIDRSSKQSGEKRLNMLDEMVNIIESHDDIIVVVTPEGTRKAVKRWKKGFYHVAQKAQVPMLLGYIDYEKKEVGVGKVIYPSGDIKKDMREIFNFYNKVTPRHPDKFIKL
jgi:1-acyl-sn-glycerol-3-phosphate acyltransferase